MNDELERDLKVRLLNAFRIADRAHILALESEIDDLRKRIVTLEQRHENQNR